MLVCVVPLFPALGALSLQGRFFAALVVVCVCTAANLFIRWIRWQFLARHIGLRIQSRISLTIFLVSIIALLTPFGVGELGLAYLIRSRTKHPWIVAGTLWLLCRFGDVVALAALMSFAHHRWSLLLGFATLFGTAALATRFRPEHRLISRDSAIVAAMHAWTSIAAWLFPTLALYLAGKILLFPLGFASAISVFASATLQGGWVPGGFYVASAFMNRALAGVGGVHVPAGELVTTLRLGTVVFALIVSFLALISQRRLIAVLLSGRDAQPQEHFDDLAPDYEAEIPTHMRELLLKRKADLICRALKMNNIAAGSRGLDLGCGSGTYAVDLARRGFCMSAVDLSRGQIETARGTAAQAGCDVDLRAGSLAEQSFADASFDFVYSINVMHHITSQVNRAETLKEVARILRPGGLFLLHEINVSNPLNRLYMSYVFPLINRIDDGSEVWVLPSSLPSMPAGKWLRTVDYFTFMPDFLPARFLGVAERVEQLLSKSFLSCFSAHYMATFVKADETV